MAMLSIPVPAALVNGSFELQTDTDSNQAAGSTAITGWTTTLSGVEYFKPSDFGGPAADGLWVVDLAYFTSTLSGGIRQSFATTPGQPSRLSFSLGTRTGNGRAGTAQVVLMIDGADAAVYDLANFTTSFIFEDFSFDFTPANATTTIEFQNRQNAIEHFAFLDNIRFQEIPEPNTSALMTAGLLAWFARRPARARRR